jgi:hypothetical protein
LKHLFRLLFPVLVLISSSMAQTASQPDGQAATNPPRMATPPLQISVTGCLKRGSEARGYYITDQGGTTWELISDTVNLAAHVNHSVQIAGKPVSASPTQEAKSAQNEKRETGGHAPHDLRVITLQMLSPSCTR